MAVTNLNWHRFSRCKGQGCNRTLWVESIKSYWGGKISSWCASPSKVNTTITMILMMAPAGDLYLTMRYYLSRARFSLRTFGLFWLSRWPKTKDKHLSQVYQVARWRLFLDVRDTEEQCPPLSSSHYLVGGEGSTLCWLDGHLGEGHGVDFGQWPIPCRQATLCYIHGHWTGNRRTDWVFSSMAATQ